MLHSYDNFVDEKQDNNKDPFILLIKTVNKITKALCILKKKTSYLYGIFGFNFVDFCCSGNH